MQMGHFLASTLEAEACRGESETAITMGLGGVFGVFNIGLTDFKTTTSSSCDRGALRLDANSVLTCFLPVKMVGFTSTNSCSPVTTDVVVDCVKGESLSEAVKSIIKAFWLIICLYYSRVPRLGAPILKS